MASGSTGSSSTSRSVHWRLSRPLCEHGLETDVLTSHTERNPGRRFFCCPMRKWDDCDFFQWVDWLAPSNYSHNQCNRFMKSERERFEVLLDLKEGEHDMLADQLLKKTKECEELEVKLADASKCLEEQKKRNWIMKWALRACVLAFVARIVFLS